MKKCVRLIIAIILFGCFVLSGCTDYANHVAPTSHYATGKYTCYYHDVRDGHFYRAIDSDKMTATRAARNNCIQTSSPKDDQHIYCEFAECLFK